ncbi:NRAMP-like transporter smf-3 [Coniosporium apollinis]|uniref:NRAMP-like transporter smf-3 n=1 Tax=Coniosporium apollinis TaxID=61459 RepID=A0ABQ9NW14_9PEZI|nr:NRAMP-like transporter smf-3 [Coniosporium apollinis]
MNCPSRIEHDLHGDWNQNPNALNADATMRNDLNHIANLRRSSRSIERDEERDTRSRNLNVAEENSVQRWSEAQKDVEKRITDAPGQTVTTREAEKNESTPGGAVQPVGAGVDGEQGFGAVCKGWIKRIRTVLIKYVKFIGPGFMVAVAYIDPGNYATDVAAGAAFEYKLLFMILVSNIFAIFLQSLCVKLGSVTGMDLAQNCKAHCPPWLNYTLYCFAEAAIIATDIAEVIGTAIALNVLINIPLVAGCAISIVDVLIILFWYRPTGTMRGVRAFEIFVMLLVIGVVVCFCFQLSLIKDASIGAVFRGYLPSEVITQSKGLYQACGILGATVMPHSLYLGSGIVQSRLRAFDEANPSPDAVNATATAVLSSSTSIHSVDSTEKYRPSLRAIKSCLSYSIVETALSLFTFALFVNSAILIVAGASLHGTAAAEDADLFQIHALLSSTLSPAAGTIFALALLLSGTSAGIVCTIAGQMVSEGQLNWKVKPWVRRLITRSISITPSIIIAGAVGRDGLSRALEASQVALSVILPFVTAPLIWFTCWNKYMTVVGEGPEMGAGDQARDEREAGVAQTGMRNHWVTAGAAVLIWGIIVIMNGALIVLSAMGKT